MMPRDCAAGAQLQIFLDRASAACVLPLAPPQLPAATTAQSCLLLLRAVAAAARKGRGDTVSLSP